MRRARKERGRIGSSKKKLAYFMDENIYTLDAVPTNFELGEAQINQVAAHKLGKPIIDKDAIAAELASYSYPLYFFDYETFAPAVPAFDGFAPYQRIPFRFLCTFSARQVASSVTSNFCTGRRAIRLNRLRGCSRSTLIRKAVSSYGSRHLSVASIKRLQGGRWFILL